MYLSAMSLEAPANSTNGSPENWMQKERVVHLIISVGIEGHNEKIRHLQSLCNNIFVYQNVITMLKYVQLKIRVGIENRSPFSNPLLCIHSEKVPMGVTALCLPC